MPLKSPQWSATRMQVLASCVRAARRRHVPARLNAAGQRTPRGHVAPIGRESRPRRAPRGPRPAALINVNSFKVRRGSEQRRVTAA